MYWNESRPSDGGRLVTLSAKPSSERPEVTVKSAWVRPDAPALTELGRLASTGELTLRVAETVPFDAAADAHRRLAAGGLRGRIVFVP